MKPFAIFTPPGTVPAVHATSYWTPLHLAGLAAVLAFFAVALIIALLTMIRDWKETALCLVAEPGRRPVAEARTCPG